MMSAAVPCVNAMSTGVLTRLSSQPKRASPSASCSAPAMSASHTASNTHCALPGAASPVSEADTSDDSAVGPTDSRVDAENSAPASAGSKLAYTPAAGGMPASCA